MKRHILLGILVIGVILVLQGLSFADDYELKEWSTTVEQLEISKDGGATWFTVFEGRTTPMSMIGNPDAPTGDKTVPAGVYNSYRVHVTYNKFVVEYNNGTNGASNLWQGANQYIESTDESIETGDMTCTVNADGTTNAYIDFDPNTAINACSATWDDVSKYILNNFDFEPVVTVRE